MSKIEHPNKPFETYTSQINKLESRDLIIDCSAKEALYTKNYFRLSAYLIKFKSGSKYVPNTKLSTVLRYYEMDASFRRYIVAMLEHVEINLRTAIAHTHSKLYGGLGYTDCSNMDSKKYKHHKRFLSNIIKDRVDATENKLFIQKYHHSNKYNDIPLWVLVEVLTFDNLYCLFLNMKSDDKDKIAEGIYNIKSKWFTNWFSEFKDIRNECAHYHRLYNTHLETDKNGNSNRKSLKIHPNVHIVYNIDSYWLSFFLACKYVLKNSQDWTFFVNRLVSFFYDFQDVINPSDFGLPDNWEYILRGPLEYKASSLYASKKAPTN